MPRPNDQHRTDFYSWTRRQSALLRAGRLSDVDIENVAEEIEDMGRSEARELRSILGQLILHLLKWQHQPGRRSRSWAVSVAKQQKAFAQHINRNPGLKGLLDELYAEAWDIARLDAAGETDLPLRTFPDAPAWPLEDALRPGGPGGDCLWDEDGA